MHRDGQLRLHVLPPARGLSARPHDTAVANRDKGDIGPDLLELREPVGIAGVVIGTTAELHQVADPVVRLRMRLQPRGVDVVGRDGLDLDPGDVNAVAWLHGSDLPGQLLGNVGWRDERGLARLYLSDVALLIVITVGVGDEDEVGGWQISDQSPWIDVHDELLAFPAKRRLLVPGERLEHR